jgi:hypothetical protein
MRLSEMKAKGFGAMAGLLSAGAGVVTLVAYTVYGITFDYLDAVVEWTLLAGILCAVADTVLDQKAFGLLNLISTMFISYALGLFALNSFPVWADNLNGITMYASRGGLVPVVILLLLFLITVVLEMISCFMTKGGKKA